MRGFLPGFAISLIIIAAMSRADEPAGEPQWTDAQLQHWSFQPPRQIAPPKTARADWVRNPIDAFVLKGLEDAGLTPASEAEPAALLRRLFFDLTGLPPSPEEVAAFENDGAADAYETVVDRLLASPRYGERWARPWLDLARFSESDGFKADVTRPDMWRYRDWVIRALNADMPYDRFVRLQLAGDELEPNDPDAFIATGFNRNWPFEDNNKVPGLNRELMLEDMTDTTASVFLGLTLACARCHDHKYDPISQKDYYRFEAIFAASTPRDDRPLADAFTAAVHQFVRSAHEEHVAAKRRELESLERPYLATLLKDKLAKLPADVREAFETEPERRSAFQEDLLKKNAAAMRVEPKNLRALMTPAVRTRWETQTRAMAAEAKKAPSALPVASGMTDTGTAAPAVFVLFKGTFGQPREEVAPGFPSVLAASYSPLAAASAKAQTTGRRAALARWLTTPDHPLTTRVMVNRLWQGHFGRGLVATPSDFGTQGERPSHPELLDWLASELVARDWSLKSIHRLIVTSATYRQSSTPSKRALADDPDNILLGRVSRRRLEGEQVRDAILAVSGQLNLAMGGPSVFPDLPPGVTTRGGWTRSEKASDRNRRSIYVFNRRNLKYPLFDAFDAPDPNVTCPERNVSVNAPQALMLLNSDLILEAAKRTAERIRAEAPAGTIEDYAQRLIALSLGRAPTAREVEAIARFVRDDQSAGLAGACHAVFNLNEFVFVD